MSTPVRSPITSLLGRLLPRLRFPHLFAILAGLLVFDLIVPDPIPLVDELTLAVLTFLIGSWRVRREPQPPPRDVTPPEEPPPTLPPPGQDVGSRG